MYITFYNSHLKYRKQFNFYIRYSFQEIFNEFHVYIFPPLSTILKTLLYITCILYVYILYIFCTLFTFKFKN